MISVCGGHLAATSAEQHIYSHARFGDGNYGNKEDCDWIVEAPPGKNVHLSFRIFEMEDEQVAFHPFCENLDCYYISLQKMAI